MTTYTSRLFRDRSDVDAIVELITALPDPFPSASDMRELLSNDEFEPMRNIRLWLDHTDQLVGYGMVQLPYDNLLFDVLPTADAGVADRIIGWGAERMAEVARERNEAVAVDAFCIDDDRERKALLERNGFMRQEGGSLQMARPLKDGIPPVTLAPEFVVRPLAGPNEVEAYVQLHRAAFGTKNMTVKTRMAILEAPGYRPDLDLVLVAPDGTLAAFCVCALETDSQPNDTIEGRIDIIGVHPQFKGTGLGRTMLLIGLHALQGAGAMVATLGVSSSNQAALHLYESVAFQVTRTTLSYSRPIEN